MEAAACVDILMAGSYVRSGMTITVELSPYLVDEAKRVAAESGRTLDAVISDALCESLNARRARQQAPPEKVKLPTLPGGHLRPGVDLNNSAALLELMESERDSDRRQRADFRVSRKRR